MTDAEKIAKALYFAAEYGQIDGAHHKLWVIDQMVRALTAVTDSRPVMLVGYVVEQGE